MKKARTRYIAPTPTVGQPKESRSFSLWASSAYRPTPTQHAASRATIAEAQVTFPSASVFSIAGVFQCAGGVVECQEEDVDASSTGAMASGGCQVGFTGARATGPQISQCFPSGMADPHCLQTATAL